MNTYMNTQATQPIFSFQNPLNMFNAVFKANSIPSVRTSTSPFSFMKEAESAKRQGILSQEEAEDFNMNSIVLGLH